YYCRALHNHWDEAGKCRLIDEYRCITDIFHSHPSEDESIKECEDSCNFARLKPFTSKVSHHSMLNAVGELFTKIL
ncbi:unnamed protein product, partial [Bubo scandiacus]